MRVPTGTLVYEIKLDQEKESKEFIFDLSADKQSVVLAKGGQAGKGNKLHPNMKE